jgi:predicted negative regulator of RcsB-dependent stress response
MVDDYSSDREQEEALLHWWRENRSWIFGGIVLGLALLFGWRWWQAHTTKQAEQASTLYQEYQSAAADPTKSNAVFDRMVKEFPRSAYTIQARLLQAKQQVEAGQYDEAAAQLRHVIDQAKDDELVQIARQRLARVLIQQGKHDEAIGLLEPNKAGAFTAQVREIRGDAFFAKGDQEAARAEYAAALAPDAEGRSADAQVDRSLLELKLQQVGGSAATEAAAAAPVTQGQP